MCPFVGDQFDHVDWISVTVNAVLVIHISVSALYHFKIRCSRF